MLSRREWGQRCVAALWAGAASGALAAPAPVVGKRTQRIVVAASDKTAFCYLPLTIASRLGFFEAEGVSLELREYADVSTGIRACLEGAAHMLSGPYATTLIMRTQGELFSSFLLQGLAPQIVLGASHHTMQSYRSARDLRGRRIGVTALGSASHRIARLALSRAGVAESEVRFVPMHRPSEVLWAFRTGELDAICHPDPLITRLEQSGELRVLLDTRTVRGTKELFGGPLPAACLASTTQWLAANPELCQAAAYAMVRALKWLQTAGPSDISKAVPEAYFRGDRGLYLAAFERAREAWSPDGLMPESGPETVVRMLERFSEMPDLGSNRLASTYTNQFAMKAKARFRV
ncbi:MAG TPA: ABC transporter substrate-binding protein [Hydrogenophaga sp.]